MKRLPGNKKENYEKSIKEIGNFKTVEGFWKIYNHLIRPNDLPNTMDYLLFKKGIKPMWEDPANKKGGKWIVRIPKGTASRYWEDLVLAIIGEQFDVGNEICGAVISVRFNEDIISLWNRNADNKEACSRIRDSINKVLNLPSFVECGYKSHDSSMHDNSSFRNTNAWGRHDRNYNNRAYSKDSRHSKNDKAGSSGSRNPWTKDKKDGNAHSNHNNATSSANDSESVEPVHEADDSSSKEEAAN